MHEIVYSPILSWSKISSKEILGGETFIIMHENVIFFMHEDVIFLA